MKRLSKEISNRMINMKIILCKAIDRIYSELPTDKQFQFAFERTEVGQYLSMF